MQGSAEDRLFAYGTLIHPDVMHAVTGRRLASRPASLTGFRRVRVRGERYPGIVPDAGSRTEGRLYEGLDEGLLEQLDAFEGDLYERRAVAVRSTDGAVWAVTYVVPRCNRARLEPGPWDEARFLREDLPGFVARCRGVRHGSQGR